MREATSGSVRAEPLRLVMMVFTLKAYGLEDKARTRRLSRFGIDETLKTLMMA